MRAPTFPPQTTAAKLRQALDQRAEAEGILAAWLFGSVARGTSRPDSDVDVAVLFQEAPPRSLAGVGQVFRLEEELAEETGLPIQVVNLHRSPPDLIVRVLSDSQLLVDRQPLRRIAFEVASRKEHWDLEPYSKLYRAQTAT